MADRREITIEGYTCDEILALSKEELSEVVFSNEPFVFRVGSAEILGQFAIIDDKLILELAQIDGGGEGVLATVAALAQRYARQEGLGKIEWRVHAINCAHPNLRLRRILERRGFQIKDVTGSGECYYFVSPVQDST